MFVVLGFLVLIVAAAVAGAVVALRDTLLGDAVRIPTRPELVRADPVRARR